MAAPLKRSLVLAGHPHSASDVADFTRAATMFGASRALLHGKLVRGGMGTGMPSWGGILTDDQAWSVVEYLQTLVDLPAAGVPAHTSASGRPRLVVTPTRIDFGKLPVGKMVRASFELRNTGDAVLRLTKAPWIRAERGCCPPTPRVGAMVVEPGGRTTITVESVMSRRMAGPHDFRHQLETNDPVEPLHVVPILANWIE